MLIRFTVQGYRFDAGLRGAYQRGSAGLSGRSALSAGRSEVNQILNQRNEKLAMELATIAAAQVKDSIGTKSVDPALRRFQSMGRLVRITGARGNAFASPTAFGVGREDYLDRQTAALGRYWRSFEFGYEGHVGNRIRLPGRFKIGGTWTTLKALPPTRGRGEKDPSIRTVPWGPVVIKRAIQAHDVYGNLARTERELVRRHLEQNARLFYRSRVRLAD